MPYVRAKGLPGRRRLRIHLENVPKMRSMKSKVDVNARNISPPIETMDVMMKRIVVLMSLRMLLITVAVNLMLPTTSVMILPIILMIILTMSIASRIQRGSPLIDCRRSRRVTTSNCSKSDIVCSSITDSA